MLQSIELKFHEQSVRLLDEEAEDDVHKEELYSVHPQAAHRGRDLAIIGFLFVVAILMISAVGIYQFPQHFRGVLAKLDAPMPVPIPIVRFDDMDCTTWPDDVDIIRRLPQSIGLKHHSAYRKPKGFKIVALIFFGRARYVDILDCYMQQNMASNGGYLDEVHLMVHPRDELNLSWQLDLKWLDGLIERRPEYQKIIFPIECKPFVNFGCMYSHATQNDTLYIKLDDDISFIAQDAIPKLVESRINNPHAFAVSANVVNSPLTDWIHYSQGTSIPYLPVDEDSERVSSVSWRASDLPLWEGNATMDMDVITMTPPYRGHRWLPLAGSGAEILNTPSKKSSVDQFGIAWKSWAMAAQTHYSLLDNLESGNTWRYHFGGSNGTWNTQFVRSKLNFIAIWGKDVAAAAPIGWDDEYEITTALPRKYNRPFLIASDALVAHFSFHGQIDGLFQTDLLDRWRAYANDQVCHAANQKRPMDPRCPGY